MTKRLGAGVVRANWRDLLDTVLLKGLQIIILRHHKPIAVLISYEKWLEMGGKDATIVEVPSDTKDVQVVMIFDDKLPADL